MEKENKKKIKTLIITFFCLIFVAAIAVGGFLLFKPNDSSTTQSKPETDKFFVAQTAIFNEEYSINYNGIYNFSRVNFVDLSMLSDEAITSIFSKYKVRDTMGLINSLTIEKKDEVNSNNERLIIENDSFQINHNTNPYIIGSIYGNDDLSIMFSESNKKLCSVSLTTLSEEDLKEIDANKKLTYLGDEIYLTKTFETTANNKLYKFDIIYVYKILSSNLA